MVESLYEEHKRTHPERFKVGWNIKDRKSYKDLYGRLERHACFGCIVKNRNPKDCDPCPDNPDRARMKKSGLL